ncbi:MAG: phytanoyl-CoA dioxygenase family protein [Verrucomicrobiota bacterium]
MVRGSHRQGDFPHHEVTEDRFVLEQEVDEGSYDPADIVTLDLKAGEISLHDAALLHGSAPNNSDRVRAGLTMRFSPANVKCDMSVWPTFEATMARGVDRYGHNPVASVPLGDGFPVAKFQHSSEFE